MDSNCLESVLLDLNQTLKSSLMQLNGPLRDELLRRLHDPNQLPDNELYKLSTESIDHLHEVKQLLEPKTLILAEHFMCVCLNNRLSFFSS